MDKKYILTIEFPDSFKIEEELRAYVMTQVFLDVLKHLDESCPPFKKRIKSNVKWIVGELTE